MSKKATKKNAKNIAFGLNAAIYVALAFLVVFFVMIILPSLFARLTYVGPLEQQEGLFLNTLRFFRKGGNIYQPPDLHFAGMIYPPLYFLVMRPIVGLFGLSFFVTRFVSMLAIGGTAYCVYVIVKHFTANRWAALNWLPFYFAAWPLYGWMDLGRLEAFYMFVLFAAGACAIKANGNVWRYLATGLLFGCAAATKQTGIFFLPVLLVAPFFDRRAIFMLLGAVLAASLIYGLAIALFGVSLLDWAFIAVLHHNHALDVGINIMLLWCRAFPGTIILLAMFCYGVFKLPVKRKKIDLFLLLSFLFIGCAGAMLTMFKEGAGPMNLALWAAFILLTSCMACAQALSGGNIRKGLVLISLLALCEFAYEAAAGDLINQRTPANEDAAAFENLVKMVRDQPGDVWITSHPWVNILAGKPAFAPTQEMEGEWAGGHPGASLPPDVIQALSQRKFSMIVTGDEYGKPAVRRAFQDLLSENYRFAGELVPEKIGIERIDGVPLMPRYIWVPK